MEKLLNTEHLSSIEEKLRQIQENKEQLQVYVKSLEKVMEHVTKLVSELLTQDVPATHKFMYKRVMTIDALLNSVTKLGELLRKLREDVHNINMDEIKMIVEVHYLAQSIESETTNIDVRMIWQQLTKIQNRNDVTGQDITNDTIVDNVLESENLVRKSLS